jgi:NAD(P)-dependent dehydrogenase (short-subunit alcohol dehydrogenase family)
MTQVNTLLEEEISMSENNRLNGKVAIITGGASGMGRGMCLEFSAQGAAIAVVDINVEGATRVAEEIEEHGGRAMVLEVDVRNPQEVTQATARALDRFGTIDILVNCAGVNEYKDPEETSNDDWENIRSIILDGAWYFSSAVIPVMKKNKKGKIVNIGSGAAIRGVPQSVPYTASKHGLVGMTRALAVDLGPSQVNVNCICPGAIDTPLLRKVGTDAYIEEEIKRYPLGRLGSIADVVKAALFLVSPDSDWITGIVLSVDGGLTSCIRVKNAQ